MARPLPSSPRSLRCCDSASASWEPHCNLGGETSQNFKEPFSKIVFGDLNGEKIEKLEKMLKAHPKADNFGLVRSESILYEILPKNIHKGTALIKLCELLGIDKKKTIAIGDNYNDIGMIKEAGIGVAVGNAEQAVKDVADEVTLTNNEGAIARIIYNLDDGKYKF